MTFDFVDEVATQVKMENIWANTCGTWENCNETTIQSFLSRCDDYNIDPQFCMSWVETHKDLIPNWGAVSETSLNWVNDHTSSGSSFSVSDENFS
ncbi:hypothetical protein [Neobacillus sp. PS3-40]|uniref:hypothetical protein n=1 Tax=Neobacillus sp. PS3-40 TaxID=3070679 RepID=UPI0027DF3B5C|nr:hypothetical protein [Neobacillus sp. PS3-40]WML44734.1 hypothetical protein RCG20_02145 [Neobacillus sp. PS3-40]